MLGKFLGGVTAYFLFGLINHAVGAWVLVNLWAWFVIPVFDAPALNYIQAAGVNLTVGFLTYNTSDVVVSSDEGAIEGMANSCLKFIVICLLVMLSGFIISRFI